MTTTFLPTTRVTVLDTGTVLDDNGDPKANDTPAVEHLPAVWGQRGQRTWLPVEQRYTTIRVIEVRLRPGTAVTTLQRLRNERTGETIAIRSVEHESTLGVAGDVLVRGQLIGL